MVYFKVPPDVLSEGHDTKKTQAGQTHSTLNFATWCSGYEAES